MKGHRSAIATMLKQLGWRSFSEDPLLRDVIRGVSLNEVHAPKRFPDWDILPVLGSLRLPPIESCGLKFLSYKARFEKQFICKRARWLNFIAFYS